MDLVFKFILSFIIFSQTIKSIQSDIKRRKMRKEAIEKFILKANKILKGDNMDINITTQLEDFGLKELDDAAKLLLVYKKEIREDKLTDEFKKEDVKLCFNKNNGKVKLVNVYGDALVRDDNRLFLERVVD